MSDSQNKPITAPKRMMSVTPRSVLIGALLIPVLCYWVEYDEIVAGGTDLAAMSLIISAVFALFVVMVLNRVIIRIAPKFALSQGELMTIYVMQTCSVGICGIGMMQFLISTITDVTHYSTTENLWSTRLVPYLKPWLLPNPAVLHAYFSGSSSFWNITNIEGWITPILVWTGFIIVMLWVMLCLSVLVRRRWADEERLSFPITMLPLEISKEGWAEDIFNSSMFKIGFVIPVILESLASLNTLYPNIPFLPIKPSDPRLDLTGLFTNPPWNGMGTIQLSFYPMVIGLIYFLPLDVSFSLWFFYFFGKFQNVFTTAAGFHAAGAPPAQSEMPYLGEQSAGAFIMVAIYAMYGLRKHIATAFKGIFTPCKYNKEKDKNEGMDYRFALVGVVAGYCLLTAFGVAIGMPVWMPAVYFFLFYCFVVTFTRMRAEAGLPWGFGPNTNVHTLMRSGFGSAAFNHQSTVSLTLLLWSDMDMRTTQMPNQLEAMRIGEASSIKPRQLVLVILLAIVIGCFASWAALLSCYYKYGAASAKVNSWRTGIGEQVWSTTTHWLDNSMHPRYGRLEGVAAGMLFTIFLYQMRSRFIAWPFHPIGYALSGTFTMDWIWCATFIGWSVKALITRYGGMQSYRRYIPFFIGLILGDYITGSLWAIYGASLGITTYRCFPI